MKRILFSLLALWLSCSAFAAEVEIIMDDADANFTSVGTWRQKTRTECIGGSGIYTKKGDGSAYAQWESDLMFAGQYHLWMNVINGEYIQDAHVYVQTVSGDSLIIIDQYNREPGWVDMGIFDLPGSVGVKLTNYSESDSGTYVFADAIRVLMAMDTYSISGTVVLPETNSRSQALVELFTANSTTPLFQKVTDSLDRSFLFENIIEGYYSLRCTAWGFDTLQIDSLQLTGADIGNLVLEPVRSDVFRADLSGLLNFNNASETSRAQIEIYPASGSLLIDNTEAGHGERYRFSDLAPGQYRLIYRSKGFFTDDFTNTNVSITNADVVLDPITLYSYFRFAWLTDSHIGVTSCEPGLIQAIANIEAMGAEIDFIIHSGDLTEKGLNWELSRVAELTGGCSLPFYVVPGNHETKWSESGLQTFKNRYGDTHFSFDHEGYHFVGLESGIPMRGGGGYIDAADIVWLQEDLAAMESADMPVIAVWHHPADAGNISNYWKVLDILKRYNTQFIMVGHGHSNRSYDFEGIPGAMGTASYDTNGGFNLVTVSELEISVATYYNDARGLTSAWRTVPGGDKIQAAIEFTNFAERETVTATKELLIQISEDVTNGSWDISNDEESAKTLSGSGQNWSCTLNPASLPKGYNTITVAFMDAANHPIRKTREFYVDNGLPKATWRYQTDAVVITAPAYDTERVYVGTSDGKIYGLNLADGTAAWPAIQTAGAVFSSPAVADSSLYIGSTDGNLYAIHTSDGTVDWTYPTGNAVLSVPVVVDSIIYFGSNQKFIALNRFTQEEIWQYKTDGMIECKPAIVDDKVIFTSWDLKVYCLNRFDGSVKWSWSDQSSFYYAPGASWPVVGHDKVFVGDPQRYLNAIDLASGTTIWQSNSPETWESLGISENGGKVYSRTLYGDICAYSTYSSSQELVWSVDLPDAWDSSPSMIMEKDGAVFSGSAKGYVASITALTGRLNWRYWVSQSYTTTVTPLDANRVLVGALDGSITLIEGDPTVGVDESQSSAIPLKNQLEALYPNPFNSSAVIRYSLKDQQSLEISIFDLRGRKVKMWAFDNQLPGNYQIAWSGDDFAGHNLSSGIYFVKMSGRNFTDTKKISFLK